MPKSNTSREFRVVESQPRPAGQKCRLCLARLDENEDDDLIHELCGSCKGRPEARRLGIAMPPLPTKRSIPAAAHQNSARDFTAAEKGLIRKLHGFMPAQQLLVLLNERLACDLGPDALPYTIEQLYAEIGGAEGAVPAGGHDWASLRKLLANARRDGVLSAISEQVINDFAVVFSLNQKQVLVLRDILLCENGDAS